MIFDDDFFEFGVVWVVDFVVVFEAALLCCQIGSSGLFVVALESIEDSCAKQQISKRRHNKRKCSYVLFFHSASSSSSSSWSDVI